MKTNFSGKSEERFIACVRKRERKKERRKREKLCIPRKLNARDNLIIIPTITLIKEHSRLIKKGTRYTAV